MSKCSYSLQINRPVATVFRFIDDIDCAKKWMSGLVEMKPLTEGGNRVGARTRQVYAENGRTIEIIEETLAYEPQRLVKIKGDGQGFSFVAQYTLYPTPTGTRLEYESETKMTSLLMKLLSPIVHRATRNKAIEDLDRLKQVIELESK